MPLFARRDENNASNILEFCGRHASDTADEFSCARTDSVLVRKVQQTSSASHLRKSTVDNTGWGPDYDVVKGEAREPAASSSEAATVLQTPDGVQERVRHLEDHLSVTANSLKPVPKDFYA